jgi:hypothetical protein
MSVMFTTDCWEIVNVTGTNNSPNRWFSFDFHEWVVCSAHYSLKPDRQGAHHLLESELNDLTDGTACVIFVPRRMDELNGHYSCA